jgi:hypothetical protein
LLEFGLHLRDKQFDAKSISLALYEELELLTGLVSQYFDYADELFMQDPQHYVDIKDRLLFGVLHLFAEDDTPVNASSGLEQFVNGMQHERIVSGMIRRGKYSGLDLACERQRVKIWFNTCSALLNALMINVNRQSREDMINTWEPVQPVRDMDRDSRRGSRSVTGVSSTFFQRGNDDYTQGRVLSNFASSVATMNLAISNMTTLFKLWIGGAEPHLNQLHENLTKIFQHDEWISREYMGGLNTYFTGGTFSELLETFEEGCQMSFLVSALLV